MILETNEIAAKRYGRTPENFNGQNIFDLMPRDLAERRKALLHQLFQSREPMVHEDVRAGNHFETTMCPVFDDHGGVVKAAVFARDITERKRTEETLRRRQSELAHVSRLSTMGNMATGLAHEINQPLAAIVSYTQGCIRRLRSGHEMDDDVLAAMEKVSTLALRAGEIVGRIREFARKAEPRKTKLDVNLAIRQAADLLSAEARANGVHVNLDLADPLPAVMADPIQIQQVIVNLAKNAIDAMNGSETPRRLVVIRTAPAEENEIEIAVEDTGPGMKPVQLERAFEPFYTTTAEGLGLGLPISQDIVEAHGGRMWAASDAGSGAPSSDSPCRTPTEPRMTIPTVFVVNDDRAARESPAWLFGSIGLGLSVVRTIVEGHGGRMVDRSVPESGNAIGIGIPPDSGGHQDGTRDQAAAE